MRYIVWSPIVLHILERQKGLLNAFTTQLQDGQLNTNVV